jgi:chromosome segregation ATPase
MIAVALTKDDLQAIGELMDDKLEPINARLENVEQEIGGLNQRIEHVEQEIGGITQRLDHVEQDVRRINQSVAVLEKDLTFKVNIVYENIVDINNRNQKIDRIEEKQENHEDRIWALEQTVKASHV